MAKVENVTINYGMRWKPDFRYQEEKKVAISLKNFVSKEPSKTDKEAYRVTLASMRGTLASNLGSSNVGSYSIPAGEEYDPRFDFSYLNRPDLTIVDLDNYITSMKESLENYDSNLKAQIEEQIQKAESMLDDKKAVSEPVLTKNGNKGEE